MAAVSTAASARSLATASAARSASRLRSLSKNASFQMSRSLMASAYWLFEMIRPETNNATITPSAPKLKNGVIVVMKASKLTVPAQARLYKLPCADRFSVIRLDEFP